MGLVPKPALPSPPLPLPPQLFVLCVHMVLKIFICHARDYANDLLAGSATRCCSVAPTLTGTNLFRWMVVGGPISKMDLSRYALVVFYVLDVGSCPPVPPSGYARGVGSWMTRPSPPSRAIPHGAYLFL